MNKSSYLGRWPAALAAGLLVAAFAWLLPAQQDGQYKQAKQNPNFQGTVTPITENSQGAIAHFRFEAGSRTKWHSHSGGQIILCEEGTCRAQTKGGPVIELHAGETTYSKPGETHWHGAAPTAWGVQYNVTRGEITWMNEVSDAEFSAAPGRR
jgi:quercetin dioxygenase-like cupin family protein